MHTPAHTDTHACMHARASTQAHTHSNSFSQPLFCVCDIQLTLLSVYRQIDVIMEINAVVCVSWFDQETFEQVMTSGTMFFQATIAESQHFNTACPQDGNMDIQDGVTDTGMINV